MQIVERSEKAEQEQGSDSSPGRPRDVLLNSRGFIQWFVVKKAGKITLLSADEVRWVEAAGNYVRLHTSDGSQMIRASLSHLEDSLDPGEFRRIQRSIIVNLEAIDEILSDGHGGFEVALDSGRRLRMTRTYRENVVP